MACRRMGWLPAGLLFVFFGAGVFGPALAAQVGTDPRGLAVTPATALPGDTVVWSIVGPPGATAVLAWSRAGGGASFQGVLLALGPDFQIMVASPISAQGRLDFALRVPDTVPTGPYFFQAATIRGDQVTLTNGVSVTVQPLPAPRGRFY